MAPTGVDSISRPDKLHYNASHRVWCPLFNFGGFRHATRALVEGLYSESVTDYIGSALVGSIPILVAKWSRTLWPRLAVTVALVAVQLITGSIFILALRTA